MSTDYQAADCQTDELFRLLDEYFDAIFCGELIEHLLALTICLMKPIQC